MDVGGFCHLPMKGRGILSYDSEKGGLVPGGLCYGAYVHSLSSETEVPYNKKFQNAVHIGSL